MATENPPSNDFLQDLLKVYYKRLFPHSQMIRWLQYSTSDFNYFMNREISFTLADDTYLRFLSFDNAADFEREICQKVPFKIDIGAVYNFKPRDRLSINKIEPVARELVFDIDLTDFDDVRTCCNKTNVCEKCWKFMQIACKCIDSTLREDFGFQHLLWVFSGRRGIHCWVCDASAREMSSKGRSAVAEYINLLIGSCSVNGTSRASFGPKKHHSVKRCLKLTQSHFKEIIIDDQKLFANEDGKQKLASFVPFENLRDEFLKSVRRSDSLATWNSFISLVETNLNGGKGNKWKEMKDVVEEIQLSMLYPRIDINVSKGFNHLLKAPFCIHPKTGKVCVPFNPQKFESFKISEVPSISTLLDELNIYDKENDGLDFQNTKIKEYKKTSIFKSVLVFEHFLKNLLNDIEHTISNVNLEF